MANRYEELDSLRGLASINVMLYHMVSVSTLWFSAPLLMYSPVKVFVAGHQAVILFFVLSGFVLSIPFTSGNVRYTSYMIRRICRIYIPYICAVGVGCLMRVLVSPAPVGDLWNVPISFQTILNHVFLIGMFNQDTFDPVIWSLVHEMRISLVFPILMYLINLVRARVALVSAVVLWGLGLTLHYFFPDVDIFTNYMDTFQYISMFIVGAVFAKNIQVARKFFSKLTKSAKVCLFCFGLLCYAYSTSIYHPWDVVMSWLFTGLHKSHYFLQYWNDFGGVYVSNLVTTVSVSIIIAFALFNPTTSKLLTVRPVKFMGKISYSLYLYHLVVLLVFETLFKNIMTLWVIWGCVIAISVLIATLSYSFIEVPAIKLGRHLTRNVDNSGGLKFPIRVAGN